MKKGLLFYCLVLSVVFHLALVAFIRLDQSGKKKEKEPIAIDLVGPLNEGPKTVLPSGRKSAPPFAQKEEKAPPTRMARVMPYIRPSMPVAPSPAAPPPPPAIGEMLKNLAKAPSPMPSPGDVRVPEQSKGGPLGGAPGARQPSAPSAPSPARPEGGGAEGPRRIAGLTERELSKIVEEKELEKKDDTITLDTDDLRYTAYLDGLKRRIELIWKYPETARRDGLQGSLVMRFTIEKSGKVERENIELVKSSGYPMLDDAAKQALIDASPFNPLPGNWKKDNFTITGTFIYRLYGMYLR
jgi:protein TonB